MKKMRVALAVMVAAVVTCVLGCGGFIAKQMMDAATDNTIKILEAEAKIEREKRQEKYTVEGEVAKIEMRDKEVADLDPKNMKRSEEKSEDGKSVKIKVEPGKKTIKT